MCRNGHLELGPVHSLVEQALLFLDGGGVLGGRCASLLLLSGSTGEQWAESEAQDVAQRLRPEDGEEDEQDKVPQAECGGFGGGRHCCNLRRRGREHAKKRERLWCGLEPEDVLIVEQLYRDDGIWTCREGHKKKLEKVK